jgi:hypothetical protein
MKKLLIAILVFTCLVVVPQLVIGLESDNLTENQTNAMNEIKTTVGSITLFIRLIGGAVGTLVLTAGGVMFMTAGEKPERKEQAKQILTMGVIGLVIILIAPAVVTFIIG